MTDTADDLIALGDCGDVVEALPACVPCKQCRKPGPYLEDAFCSEACWAAWCQERKK